MKKIILYTLLITICVLQATQLVYAANSTPTPTQDSSSATGSADLNTIQKIKQMVANKISKLNLVEKRGILGTVKDVSNTQITIEKPDHTQQFIDIDELTKFEDSIGSSKTFGISDIKAGDQLAFIGNYNKDTRRLMARIITKADSIPMNIEGMVTDKDTQDYVLTVVMANGNKKKISIETSTKSYEYDSDSGESKSGFSKIEIGQRIIVVGFQDPDDKNSINASRILHFAQLPPSQEMKKYASAELQTTPSPTEKAK